MNGKIDILSDNVGGIIGGIKDGTITRCSNLVNVTGSGSNHGGICGVAETSTITECNNSASVAGSINIGGIIGYIEDSNVQKCKNTTSILGDGGWGIAGIVGGACKNSDIQLCYNMGEVTQLNSNDAGAGGILGTIGDYTGVTVQNCYNSGNLSSSADSGGIVGGARNVTITGCYNIGNISSDKYEGGIVGATWSGEGYNGKVDMSYCYWSDKDKNGNLLPTNAVGYIGTGSKKTEEQVSKRPLEIFTGENIYDNGTNASYWLNQENVTGAWIQDFEGVNGKYMNNKYPYLVENLP